MTEEIWGMNAEKAKRLDSGRWTVCRDCDIDKRDDGLRVAEETGRYQLQCDVCGSVASSGDIA